MPTVRKRCSQCQNWRPCPTHQRAYDRRRPHAVARGYRADTGSEWQRVRRAVLRRDPVCMWGSQARDRVRIEDRRRSRVCTRLSTDAAHLRPRRGPEDDTLENLRGLCHAHHSQETATRESFGRGKPRV